MSSERFSTRWRPDGELVLRVFRLVLHPALLLYGLCLLACAAPCVTGGNAAPSKEPNAQGVKNDAETEIAAMKAFLEYQELFSLPDAVFTPKKSLVSEVQMERTGDGFTFAIPIRVEVLPDSLACLYRAEAEHRKSATQREYVSRDRIGDFTAGDIPAEQFFNHQVVMAISRNGKLSSYSNGLPSEDEVRRLADYPDVWKPRSDVFSIHKRHYDALCGTHELDRRKVQWPAGSGSGTMEEAAGLVHFLYYVNDISALPIGSRIFYNFAYCVSDGTLVFFGIGVKTGAPDETKLFTELVVLEDGEEF